MSIRRFINRSIRSSKRKRRHSPAARNGSTAAGKEGKLSLQRSLTPEEILPLCRLSIEEIKQRGE